MDKIHTNSIYCTDAVNKAREKYGIEETETLDCGCVFNKRNLKMTYSPNCKTLRRGEMRVHIKKINPRTIQEINEQTERIADAFSMALDGLGFKRVQK